MSALLISQEDQHAIEILRRVGHGATSKPIAKGSRKSTSESGRGKGGDDRLGDDGPTAFVTDTAGQM